MFDIGWTEMLVVAVVAIVVVGPRDLPKLLRTVGNLVRQMRGLAREFKGGVDELIRESELDEVRKSIHHVSNFDPANRPERVIDPAAEAAKKAQAETTAEAAKKAHAQATVDADPEGKGAGRLEDGKGDGA